MQKECVLLHGWGMNQGVWHQLLPKLTALNTNYVFKALDLPGFGQNNFLPEPYTLESVAKSIAEKLADQTCIVAWSLGGLIAVYIAKHWPEKVSKIIMVASSPYFTQQDNWPGIKVEVLENFVVQLQRNSQKTIERFLAIQALGSEHAKEDIKLLKQSINAQPEPSPLALNAGLNILLNDDLRNEFSALKQPIYGIFGRLDSLVPQEAIEFMHDLNSRFESKILSKASHAPFISHPDEFIRALKRYV